MKMDGVEERLKDTEYRNWVKAALCIQYTRDGLVKFADQKSQELFRNVKHQLQGKGIPPNNLCGSISYDYRRKAVTCCHSCQVFLAELRIFRYGNQDFNLKNSDHSRLLQHHWQIAKLFMNIGQDNANENPDNTDTSGLLNFMDHCLIPRNAVANPDNIIQVRDTRNRVLHSSDMKISGNDFQNTITQVLVALLKDPDIQRNNPIAERAIKNIDEIKRCRLDIKAFAESEDKALKELVKEIQQMVEQATQIVESNENTREEVNAAYEKIQTMYEPLNTLVKKNTDLLDKFGSQVTDIKTALEILNKRMEAVEKEIKEHGQEIKEHEQELKEHGQELKKHGQEIKEHGQEIQTVKAGQNRLEKALQTVKDQHNGFEKRLGDFEQKVESKKRLETEQDEKLKKNLLYLPQYLKEGYDDEEITKITISPVRTQLCVSEIYSPMLLYGDKTVNSYEDIFCENSNPIFIVGKAGMGKSTFCKYLAHAWCTNTHFPKFNDTNVLRKFRYLFYIQCRFAKNYETILEMIKNQLFDNQEMKKAAKHAIKHESENCLIVLDGADEWEGRSDTAVLPDLAGVENCTLLITTRPWKFNDINKSTSGLSESTGKLSKQLKLLGLKNKENLITEILERMKDPDPGQSCFKFMKDVKNCNLLDLVENPLMLVCILNLWKTTNILHTPLFLNYIDMLKLFIGDEDGSRSDSRFEVERKECSVKLPVCCSDDKLIKRYAGLIYSQGHQAFQLLFGTKQQSLVFLKSSLSSETENEKSFDFCLEIGILNKTSTLKHGSKHLEVFEFCHKTFQEFLAAFWLSQNYEAEKATVLDRLKTLRDVFDCTILIRFLCGCMSLEQVNDFLDRIVNRVKFEINVQNLQTDIVHAPDLTLCLQVMFVSFIKEMPNRELLSTYLPYIVIEERTAAETKSFVLDILKVVPIKIRSIRIHPPFSQQGTESNNVFRINLDLGACCNLNVLMLGTGSVMSLDENSELSIPKGQHVVLKNLVLPFQNALNYLIIANIMLPHACYKKLNEAMSSMHEIQKLELNELVCEDHSEKCSVLSFSLDNRNLLQTLTLQNLCFEDLVLGRVILGRLIYLNLANITLPHDCFETLDVLSMHFIQTLHLAKLVCRDHGVCGILSLNLNPKLHLSTLKLQRLVLKDLVLPTQDIGRLEYLTIANVTLPHDSLEKLNEAMSSMHGIKNLGITELVCKDHSEGCSVQSLNLSQYSTLHFLQLEKLFHQDIQLPSQHVEKIQFLIIANLTLQHDCFEKLNRALSFMHGLVRLELTELVCKDHLGGCSVLLLDLNQKLSLGRLKLHRLVLKDLVLLPQDRGNLKYLTIANVRLPHDCFEDVQKVVSSRHWIEQPELTELICGDHFKGCSIVFGSDTSSQNEVTRE